MTATSEAIRKLIDLIVVQQCHDQLCRVLAHLPSKDPLHRELHRVLKGLELILASLMERQQ